MPMNADNIQVARPQEAGCFYSAPTSVTSPASASAALTSFVNLGWLTADGIKMTINSETVSLDAFGGETVVEIESKHDVSFKITPMEFTNVDTLKEVFGAGNVSGSGSSPASVSIKARDVANRKYVFDMRMRNGLLCRVVLHNAKLSAVGDYSFKHDAAVAGEWTLKALPSATNGNVKVSIYFAAAAGECMSVSPTYLEMSVSDSETVTITDAQGSITVTTPADSGLTASVSGTTLTVATSASATGGDILLSDGSTTVTIPVTIS